MPHRKIFTVIFMSCWSLCVSMNKIKLRTIMAAILDFSRQIDFHVVVAIKN